jgi:hypothetical protein
VNPHRICWQFGPGGQATIIFFILAIDADAYWLLTLTRGPVTIFLNETCFPKLLEPIKQHLKIIKI